MTPEKRKKIQAILDCPASSENEKAIARKLLMESEPPGDSGRVVAIPIGQVFVTFGGGGGGGVADMFGKHPLYSNICEKCKNWFTHEKPGIVYCEMCINFYRRQADEKEG